MRLFVPLTRDELDRLREIARIERRRPQEQAAVFITQAVAQLTSGDLAQTSVPERDADLLAEVRR